MGSGYLYEIAAHVASIEGLKATHCGDGDGDTVKELPRTLAETPAAVVLDGAHPVIPGHWERQTMQPEIHIYVSQDVGLGRAYELARSFKALVLARIRQSITTDEIMSLVLTGFRAIEDQEWPIDSGRHYFVLPCELEVKVNVSTLYQPPT